MTATNELQPERSWRFRLPTTVPKFVERRSAIVAVGLRYPSVAV
ncbi:hypothetical protein [Oxynema aestuarii]|nr:hypothetical protein [Oxynema aestuarii]